MLIVSLIFYDYPRFVNSNTPPGQGRPAIPGALLTQYLMSMLGNHDHATFGMPENGRMGDYVFNQEGKTTLDA